MLVPIQQNDITLWAELWSFEKGNYPIESCITMRKFAYKAERAKLNIICIPELMKDDI